MENQGLHIGIDVGGTTTKVGAFACEGDGGLQLLDSRVVDTAADTGLLADRVIAATADMAGQRSIASAGLALPGAVDAEGVLALSPNFGCDAKELVRFLEQVFGVPVMYANDCNAALVAELELGAAKGMEDVLFVGMGTGLGAGIAQGGRVCLGHHGMTGEIGHLRVDFSDDAPDCNCGKRGCLETYASGTGILRMARQAGLDLEDAEAVFDAVRKGDAIAENVVLTFTDVLARGLSLASSVCAPHAILLGGGIATSSDLFLEPLRARFAEEVAEPLRDIAILPASFGTEAGMYGACLVGLGQAILKGKKAGL